MYAEQPNFAVSLHMIAALAFVPLGDVADYFESLVADFPPEAEEVF